MSDPDFFKAKGYAEKRIEAETKALREKVQKLETLLSQRDNTIRELRDEIRTLKEK